MYIRPDGLYEKSIIVDKKRYVFRGHSEREVTRKILAFREERKKTPFFKEVAEDWEKEHFKEITIYTQSCYTAPLADVRKEFDDWRIGEIKPMDIQNFIKRYAAQGRAKQTVKLRLQVIKLIMDHAILLKAIDTNPALCVKLPKDLPVSTREIPPVDAIEAIKKAVDDEFGLYYYLLLYTGLRRGEALALRYEDINRTTKEIHITKTVVWFKGEVAIKSPKSKAGIRTVPLLKPLAQKLKANGKGYIFGGDKPMTSGQFQYMLRRYKKRTGIKVSPHQLRHAYATILFEAGVDSKDAKDLLGHTKESVTRDVYTHIAKKHKEQTVEKINAYIIRNTQ